MRIFNYSIHVFMTPNNELFSFYVIQFILILLLSCFIFTNVVLYNERSISAHKVLMELNLHCLWTIYIQYIEIDIKNIIFGANMG